MKAFYFLLICLLFSFSCFSQNTKYNSKDSTKVADIKYLQYGLNNFLKSELNIKLPLKKIIFFDERYDTSYISINWQNNSVGSYVQNRKLNLTNGLASSLTNYFNAFFENQFTGNNAELLCYIKTFSIKPKLVFNTYMDPVESENKVKFNVECYYAYNDTLFPAIKIDTFYEARVREIKRSFPDQIEDIVQPLIKKIAVIDTAKIKKRNLYTLQQIQARYVNRFNIPILTTNEYNKGVYKNFSEFINNAPSITVFTVKNKGVNLTLYDPNGAIISSKVFGFCDGKTCWTFSHEYCSPLIKTGNSFEYFFTLYTLNSFFVTRKFLLTLNMENGGID